MLLLHAIAATESPRPSEAGLRGRPLRRVDFDGLAAYASEFEAEPGAFAPPDLLANHALIATLDDCLPMRFPTWLDDDAALRKLLAERQADLTAALARLRGTAELAVTLTWIMPPAPAQPIAAGTPGTRYLLERGRALAASEQRRQRAEALRDLVELVAAPDLKSAQHRLAPSAAVALSSALLIPRCKAVDLRARVVEALGSQQDVRILVNGPWPPYTFVGELNSSGAQREA